MLERLAICLTTFCVLWHGMFGCCAHHDHRVNLSSVAGRGPTKAHCRCRTACQSERASQPCGEANEQAVFADFGFEPADGHESECDGERCDLTSAGDRSQVPVLACLEWHFTTSAIVTGVLPHVESFDWQDHRSSFFPVRLRSHLVLRVLLV